MIGLDTNVLVRYLTQDDPAQSQRANRLIDSQCTPSYPGRITMVVLCELVWVLRGAYRYEKRQIVAILGELIGTAELVLEHEALVSLSLSAYRTGSADFADYMIALGNKAAGCDITYSFDHKLVDERGVRRP